MSDVIVERRAKSRRAPPPKRWRNVYWLARRIWLRESESHAEGYYGPGRFTPRRVWPSRDVAEAYAQRSVERSADREYVTYVGAEEV